MTVRLYLEDPYCRSFEARVEASHPTENGWEVALDRTAFYPTGGGQPADRGTLDGIPVLDVREDGPQVWHLLTQLPPAPTLQGEIDWVRRFDHMQQHSGQHILSQVCLERLGAQTLSFHLGTDVVTIDLDAGDLSAAQAEAVEAEANRLVMDDIEVRSYFVAPEEVAALNLRKPLTKGERTRIVEIVGVDLSPCGGTHVRRTGQIGIIKLRRLEHYKGGTRVEFLCGWRALRDYQWKHQVISALARDLSVGDRDVEAAVRRSLDGEKEARRQVEHLRSQLLVYEATTLRQAGISLGSYQVVAQAFPDRAPAEVKQLAGLLVREPATIALLAALAPAPRLFFQRSGDVDLDMRTLLREVTQKYGGGGGGRLETAEGGGLPAECVGEALAWAAQLTQARLALGGKA